MIYLIGWAVFAIVGYFIGNAKGKGMSGLVLGFLLGPIGWIITAMSKGNTKACPQCKSQIHKDAMICPQCRSAQGGQAGGYVICPDCKKSMPANAPGCTNCGRANWSKA